MDFHSSDSDDSYYQKQLRKISRKKTKKSSGQIQINKYQPGKIATEKNSFITSRSEGGIQKISISEPPTEKKSLNRIYGKNSIDEPTDKSSLKVKKDFERSYSEGEGKPKNKTNRDTFEYPHSHNIRASEINLLKAQKSLMERIYKKDQDHSMVLSLQKTSPIPASQKNDTIFTEKQSDQNAYSPSINHNYRSTQSKSPYNPNTSVIRIEDIDSIDNIEEVDVNSLGSHTVIGLQFWAKPSIINTYDARITCIDAHLTGLNSNIMDYLIIAEIPNTLEELIEATTKIDNRLATRQSFKKKYSI
ncbi:hypothetical protein BB560_006938 [Smittium megazygosporum]|uniref:Uncharacterized protein n=1 Tax=Smittium megazygosporum TaxID=133381 RepID=A0A2T9Y068_9FUNG|nr:hypothetical protein BB560_006938 [Smittium megazygosporum]